MNLYLQTIISLAPGVHATTTTMEVTTRQSRCRFTTKTWPLLMLIAIYGFLRGLAPIASSAIKENQVNRFRRNSAPKTCVLPPQPAHGSYSILGETAVSSPGESVDEFTFLEINCHPKYAPNSANRVFCSKGKWSAENITCLKTCKPLVSSFFNYDCIFNEVRVPCESPMPAGTKSFLSCKKNYKPVQLPWETIHCLETGEWEHSFVICTPECGTMSIGAKLAINGFTAHQHQFHWHAAIYDKESTLKPDLPEYICGGSIVSSNKIISAAHCFWDGNKLKARSAETFAVGYGKEFSDWKNKDDKFAMYTDVKQLIIHPDYHDIVLSYTEDIAVLVLSNVIEFNQMIKPICIDWSEERDDNIEPGDVGRVPGWGVVTENGHRSLQLMQLNMPVVSRRTCRQKSPINFRPFITHDKICAGFGNGSSACHGDSGGGLIFYDELRKVFYLKGVVSTGPVHNQHCDSHQYTLFTSVSQFLPWLQDQKVHRESEVFKCTTGERISIEDKCDGRVDCEDGSDESGMLCTNVANVETGEFPAGSCILPAYPGNGSYTIYGAETAPLAWTATKHGTILDYKCNKNFVLTSGSIVECSEGQWLPSLPRCKKPCKPFVQVDGTRLQCKLGKTQDVSCYDPIAPGTDVIVSCHFGFARPEVLYSTLTCQEDSTWNYPLYNCESGCGDNNDKTFSDLLEVKNEIKNKYGEEYVKFFESSWRAYIYEKIPGADPVLICSASLVSVKYYPKEINRIITERSCFTDAKGNLRDPEHFAVGMVKLHEGWRDERDKYAFYSNISGYEPLLFGLDNIEQNITFLNLEEDLPPVSYLIRPLCIYFKDDVHFTINYEITYKGIIRKTLFNLTTVETGREICPNQNGEGIVGLSEYSQTFYLLGILSLDRNKDHTCHSGRFNMIPISL